MIDFLKKHWHTIIFSLGGPLVGLITSFIYFQTVETPNFAAGYGITLLITVVCHIAFTTVIIAQKTDEIKEKIKDTANDFKKEQYNMLIEHKRINDITEEEAENLIGKSISDSNIVKNTYVNISKYYGTQTNIGKSAIRQYEEFLSHSDPRHWIDITTYGDIHEGRFNRVQLDGRAQGRHTIHIVNSETDIINFLIVEKDNVPVELFFGWIADATDNIHIFQTKERIIIDLFENYFNLLRGRAIECFDVDYKKDEALLPSRTNNLIGKWVSVSLVKSIKSVDDFNRYSILEIKIKEGVWTLKVEVHEKNPHKKVSIITTSHAQAYGRSIFYEFQRRDLLNSIEEEGLGTYSVSEISDDIIGGVYVIPGKGKLVRTYAVRMSQDDALKKSYEIDDIKRYLDLLWETPELGFNPNPTSHPRSAE